MGIFHELTPLNDLFQTERDSLENGKVLDVLAVKNGRNFCVFVDQKTGMTYQIAAEKMIDPYESDVLVSMSELRDARFRDAEKFACGHNFVIGESLHAASTLRKIERET